MNEEKKQYYTVYFCDTFDYTKWQEKFLRKGDALKAAREGSGTMLTAHVDDPEGNLIAKFGTF